MKNDRSDAKIQAAMWRFGAAATLGGIVLVLGCARSPLPSPRLMVGALGSDGLDRFVAAHPLAPGQEIRADALERSAGASQHLVQIATGEHPHVHAAHDLQVLMVRGEGTLHFADREVSLHVGDVVTIPRGTTHWFVRGGEQPAIALVSFAPPLDAPDNVPVAVGGSAR